MARSLTLQEQLAQAQAEFEKALHKMNQAAREADSWFETSPVHFMPGEEPWATDLAEWHKWRTRMNAALDNLAALETTPVQATLL